jgi:hypothetical protein
VGPYVAPIAKCAMPVSSLSRSMIGRLVEQQSYTDNIEWSMQE